MSRTICAVAGCICEAEPRKTVCAVHRVAPRLSPSDADQCVECHGSGECPDCLGEGYRECVCDCGDEHRAVCDACVGTKQCQTCQGSGVASKRVTA